jgi:hypothetical protein
MPDAAQVLLQQVLAALDLLAAQGKGGARDAAKVLRGIRPLGRPKLDDIEALQEVCRLRAQGSQFPVCEVARRRGSTAREIHRIERRLRRKEKNGQKG